MYVNYRGAPYKKRNGVQINGNYLSSAEILYFCVWNYCRKVVFSLHMYISINSKIFISQKQLICNVLHGPCL